MYTTGKQIIYFSAGVPDWTAKICSLAFSTNVNILYINVGGDNWQPL